MEIKLRRLVGANVLLDVMRHCWDTKKLSDLNRLYASNDSILEIPEWLAICTAPRSVAMQLETHKKKHRFYLFMESGRPDRATSEFQKAYSRQQEVRFAFLFTARAIIDIAHYRLCKKAEQPTREFMALLKDRLREDEPELARLLIPMCAFRNGLCTELHSCQNPMPYPTL